jgi:ribosomal protein L37AE/L43A
MGVPAETFYLMVPVVALITLLNLRATQFCNSCGTTIVSRNAFSIPTFCSKCGAKLGQ